MGATFRGSRIRWVMDCDGYVEFWSRRQQQKFTLRGKFLFNVMIGKKIKRPFSFRGILLHPICSLFVLCQTPCEGAQAYREGRVLWEAVDLILFPSKGDACLALETKQPTAA